jgi:hypothetical protein
MMNAKTCAWSLVLCSLGTGALAVAQSNRPTASASEQCPMKKASELSDIKVELSKNGAIIRLSAKRAQDVNAVQESAQEIAAALSGGDCLMHSDKECMQHHKHEHAPSDAK